MASAANGGHSAMIIIFQPEIFKFSFHTVLTQHFVMILNTVSTDVDLKQDQQLSAQRKTLNGLMNINLPKIYQITPKNPTSTSNQPQCRSFSHFYLGAINGGC